MSMVVSTELTLWIPPAPQHAVCASRQLAIAEMKSKVDTLITVSNDLLLKIVPDNFPLNDAFKVADEALKDGVVGISDIIVKPGLINVDFADVRTIMRGAGTALMGTGWGKSFRGLVRSKSWKMRMKEALAAMVDRV